MLFHQSHTRQWMERHHLDALVVSSPVNIRYMTGYWCWIDPLFKQYMMVPGGSSDLYPYFAVIHADGRRDLIVNPVFLVNAMDLDDVNILTFGSYGPDDAVVPGPLSESEQRIYNLTHVTDGPASPTEALIHELKADGLERGRIGLEMEGLAPPALNEIRTELSAAAVLDATNLIRLIRMVKTPDEIALLERSAQINEDAAMKAMNGARPGMPIQEVVGHYRCLVAEAGADFDHFAFGVNGQGIATETDYRLQERDVLYVDFGCIYRGYFSDGGTTLALTDPPEELTRRHTAIKDCMNAAEEIMRPGLAASAVRGAMWNVLQDRGLTASFPHGHGVGLEVRDYPIIVDRNNMKIADECVAVGSDLALEENMVVNLESAMFLPGVGSVHRERSLLITDNGCRELIPHDRSKPFIPTGSL